MGLLIQAFRAFVAALFGALVVTILLQIIFRYFIGDSLSWAEEASRMMFVWLIYIGGIMTVRQGANITFDLFLESLPHRFWLPAYVAVNVFVCAFLIVVTWIGIEATLGMRQLTPILRVPVRVVYLAIPIGCAGMCVTQIIHAVETIRARRAG